MTRFVQRLFGKRKKSEPQAPEQYKIAAKVEAAAKPLAKPGDLWPRKDTAKRYSIAKARAKRKAQRKARRACRLAVA